MEQKIIDELREIHSRLGSLLLLADDKLPELEGERQISWGNKVSPQFKAGVLWIEQQLKINPDNLMDCMAFETGQTFSPSIKNLAGSSGLGLIQFMSFTYTNMIKQFPQLKQIAASHAEMGKLDAVKQLSFVYYYFKMFGNDFSKHTLEDLYMTILYPKAVGKPLDWAMPWKYGSIAYKQNSGLDLNKDQVITKAEASAGVRRMAELGRRNLG